MRGQDFEIFDGKTFSSLLKDIYDISSTKRKDIDELINSLDEHVKSPSDAASLGPIMQSLLDTSVKNDDQLVKMAQIIQRILISEIKESSTPSDIGDMLSQEEKDRLLETTKSLRVMQDTIAAEFDEVEDEITNIKRKTGTR